MTLRFPTATFAAVTLFAGLFAGIATPAHAEETASPTMVTNLPAAAKVPVRFAPRAEIVQAIAPTPVAVAEPAAPADDDRDFSSLDAAVAAQSATVEDEELKCLATGVYYESKGEPLSGQLAVADVILNRTQSGRFPSSVCSVLTQRGQFSFVKGGKLPEVDTSRPAWKTAVAIARVATKALWASPTKGALFFHARYVSPNWGRARIASIGNHIFYR